MLSSSDTRGGRSLRVALVLDTADVPNWVSQTIEQVHAGGDVEIAAILVAPSTSGTPGLAERLIRWLIARSTKTLRTGNGSLAPVNVGSEVPVIALTEDGPFTWRDEYDLIVQLGSAPVPDWVSACSRLGLWRFEYDGCAGDSETALTAGMVAGYRTYRLALQNNDTTLFQCSYHLHPLSLAWNVNTDAWRRSHILLNSLAALTRDRDLSRSPALHSYAKLANTPSLTALLWFTARWATQASVHVLGKYWFHPTWFLAIYRSEPLGHMTGNSQFNLLWPPKGYNYADPFLFARRGRNFLFFESWKRNGGRGTIWCTELDANGVPGTPQEVLAREYHLSYPFVFEWQGDIYMLPETWDNRTIEVYRAVDFPWRWELATVLLEDCRAVDSTLVEHEGKLWLFTAGVGGATDSEGTELSVYFADSLFGEWRPHPKNPVIRDVRSARPAGSLFHYGDMLIRPAQDSSIEYGHAITLNRIEVLSQTEYSEVPFAAILPDWIAGIHATHTINQEGQFGVLDANVRLSPLSRLRHRPGSISGTATAHFRTFIGNAANRLQNFQAAHRPITVPHAEQHRCA